MDIIILQLSELEETCKQYIHTSGNLSVSTEFNKCISGCPQLMVLVVHPTPRGYIDGMRALDLDGKRQRQYVIRRDYEIRQGLFHAYNQIYMSKTVNF